MFNSVKFKYDYTIIISPWLIISIVTWPMLIDNMSNAAILTSVLFLCDTIRYINKEIKITIEAITNVTKRVITLLTKYSNIYKVLKNIGMHYASRY